MRKSLSDLREQNRYPGLRSGVQEMAGRDARRYQIAGTGVPSGAVDSPLRWNDGKPPVTLTFLNSVHWMDKGIFLTTAIKPIISTRKDTACRVLSYESPA